jgi:hypothetical protein
VADTWRYFQLGKQANLRYREALGRVTLKGDVIQELDRMCQSVLKDGKRHARLNPISQREIAVFRARWPENTSSTASGIETSATGSSAASALSRYAEDGCAPRSHACLEFHDINFAERFLQAA